MVDRCVCCGAILPEGRQVCASCEKPQLKPYVPLETEEQQALFRWAAYQTGKYPELALLYHISNEGRRNPRRAKAEGIKAGVPDLCLPVPRGPYHGAYIEMKRRKGSKTTKEQEDWLRRLHGQGYAVAVCKGWEEAVNFIINYLEGD